MAISDIQDHSGPTRRALRTWEALKGRRLWLLAAAGCLVGALLIRPWDRPLSEAATAHPALGASPLLREFLLLFRLLGKTEVLLALAMVFGLLGFRRRAVEMVLALAISGALVLPLKAFVPAERPEGGAQGSFPSGDAASVAAVAAPLAARVPMAAPAAAAALGLVGFSRVIYGRHYPSEVLAGIGLGLLACAAAGPLSRRLLRRFRLGRARRFAILAGIALPASLIVGAIASGGSDAVRLACFYGPALALPVALRHIRLARRLRGGSPSRTASLWTGRHGAIAIAAAVIILYALVASGSTLWDRDEPRFARATVEMIESGDYLVPTFNGRLRPDKPILIYWLMALPVRLLGPTELAFRLPALLAAAGACLLTWWLGRRLFGTETASRSPETADARRCTRIPTGRNDDAIPMPSFADPIGVHRRSSAAPSSSSLSPPDCRLAPSAALCDARADRTGLLAMAALATTPLLMVSGTAATTDAVLLAFILAALALFVPALEGGLGWGRAALIGLALGGALLTKGPVGLAVPLLAVAATLFMLRRTPGAKRSRVAPLAAASALSLGLFFLWALPANAATSGEFVRQGLGHHVLERMSRPLESHGGATLAWLPYYLPVVVAGFFPWVLLLPGALSALLGGRLLEPRARALLIGWMVTTFALMTLVRTKLPHYVLPMWPAMALVVAGVLQRRGEGALSAADERWLGRGIWLFMPFGLALGIACLVAPWLLDIPKARGALWGLGLLVLVMTFAVRREHRSGRHGTAAAAMLVGMVLLQLHAALVALPAMERFKLSPEAAAAVRERTPPGAAFAACKYCEPSLVFYAGRRMETVSSKSGSLSEWAARPEPGVLVVPRETLSAAGASPESLGLSTLRSERGFNLSNGRSMELLVLERPAVKEDRSSQSPR